MSPSSPSPPAATATGRAEQIDMPIYIPRSQSVAYSGPNMAAGPGGRTPANCGADAIGVAPG